MRLFVAVLAGTDAWDAQPIFASADPDIVGAVVGKSAIGCQRPALGMATASLPEPSEAPPS